jgi:hypothetical protein
MSLSSESKNIIEILSVNVPTRAPSVQQERITDYNFVVPNEKEYNFLVYKNYRVSHLKIMCRNYKLKIGGNKDQLKRRIYNFLRLSVKARIIQKILKKDYIINYNMRHGPARLKRGLCVNDTDFYSMDSLSDIQYENFYSFMDIDGKVYGFDILSLYKMYSNKGKILNPYNRKPIPGFVEKELKYLIKKNKYWINFSNGGEKIIIEDDKECQLSSKQRIELRTLDVFQHMDMLNHTTNIDWFLMLDTPKIIRFIRQLYDIWNHRAQLSQNVQREICPPYGNPFRSINIYGLQFQSKETLQRMSLTLMEKMITSAREEDRKYLGSNFVLMALTLVSENAAAALPWLYFSVIDPVSVIEQQ